MKSIFQKISKINLVAFVLGLVLIAGMSAFKGANLTPPPDGWYLVSVIDPGESHTDPTNLAIGSLTSEPAETDSEGCAREDNEGDLCAVFLDFTNLATTVPATIADVNATYESITDDAQQPEE